MKKVYERLAETVGAYHRCKWQVAAIKANAAGAPDSSFLELREEWRDRHELTAQELVRRFMPSGSGIDSGPGFNIEESTEDKLVFNVAFHHMDSNGSYDGWTQHTIIAKPSLAFGFALTISGRDRNEIKDYLGDCFSSALREPAPAETPHEKKERLVESLATYVSEDDCEIEDRRTFLRYVQHRITSDLVTAALGGSAR